MSNLIEEFSEKKQLYATLLTQSKHSIESILHGTNIETFPIEARLKDESSIKEKIQRKANYEILSDIEDLCGLRVICYYESDLQKIADLINENFDVLSSSDKKQETDVEKFGYSSNHFVVKFKESWLNIPLYSNLGGLKFEIQVRTMLMHTWAAISHKTLYKNESDAPRHMRRTFSQLSALIELADEQFSRIKEMKSDYINKNISNRDSFKGLELNSDTLLELINYHFPDRVISHDRIPRLLYELKQYNSYVSDFEDRINKCQPYLKDLENELAVYYDKTAPFLAAEGICRIILDMTSPEYFKYRSGREKALLDIYKKYITKINK